MRMALPSSVSWAELKSKCTADALQSGSHGLAAVASGACAWGWLGTQTIFPPCGGLVGAAAWGALSVGIGAAAGGSPVSSARVQPDKESAPAASNINGVLFIC